MYKSSEYFDNYEVFNILKSKKLLGFFAHEC